MPDYKEVLSDLYVKREKLNAAIQAIEEMSGISSPSSKYVAAGRGEFKGLTIAAATIQFLRKSGEPQLTGDIAEALKAGGLGSNAKSLYRTVYNTLKERSTKQKDIVKVGSKWGLPPK